MIYVFKTSVNSQSAVIKTNIALGAIKGIDEWNFDLEDCDNILRVVCKNLQADNIIQRLKLIGFDCEELK